MTKPKKRDSAYYRDRLRREHPSIYRVLVAGEFNSTRAAAIAAGLIKPRSQLQVLMNAWANASPTERSTFINTIRRRAGRSSSGRKMVSVPKVVDADGRISPWASRRVTEIMSRRRLSLSDTMREMGLNPKNTALWSAMRPERKARLRDDDLIAALESWLKANEGV